MVPKISHYRKNERDWGNLSALVEKFGCVPTSVSAFEFTFLCNGYSVGIIVNKERYGFEMNGFVSDTSDLEGSAVWFHEIEEVRSLQRRFPFIFYEEQGFQLGIKCACEFFEKIIIGVLFSSFDTDFYSLRREIRDQYNSILLDEEYKDDRMRAEKAWKEKQYSVVTEIYASFEKYLKDYETRRYLFSKKKSQHPD